MMNVAEQPGQPTNKYLVMGRSRFVWRYGVLLWGLSTGIVWAIVMTFSNGGSEPFSFGRFMILLAGGVSLFPVGGYFWGRVMWRIFTGKWGPASSVSLR